MAKRVFLFIAVNLLVILMVSVILGVLGAMGVPVGYLRPGGLNYTALMVFCLVWGMGGAFISLALSKTLAKWMMGVEIISPRTNDPDGQMLYHMVGRLAKSAGIPTPEVGIYDSPEINAFATGATKRSSLVAVSTGLLERMDQDEIEGVLAHEVAHIANGDMITMTLLQGVVNAFVMFMARAVAFAIMSMMGDEDENPIAGIGSYFAYIAIVIVLEIVFMILGSLVVNWFSRWREYRADAGGAKYGGREKMISALRRLQQQTLEDTPHPSFRSLAITDKRSWLDMFSTHPPLEERIKRLEMMGR